MIEINLNPSGEKRRPTRARSAALSSAPRLPKLEGNAVVLGLFGAVFVAALAVGLVWWRTEARLAELHESIRQAQQDSTRLAGTIELIETLKARQDTITQRITMIRSIDERRYVWPHLLDEVSRSVPAFTWLTRMTSADDPQGETGVPALTIEGNAGSTQALTRFMKDLELSPFIRDVTLVTSEQAMADGRTFQRFTLEARYARPDTTMIETIPVLGVE